MKSEKTILKKLKDYIERNKFLSDIKFFKNNYWSWAAWDSWAATGKAGGCICGANYYNATLCNTRAANKFCRQVTRNLATIYVSDQWTPEHYFKEIVQFQVWKLK